MQVLAFPVLSASLEHCLKQADRLLEGDRVLKTWSLLLPFLIRGLHPELLLEEDTEKISSLWDEDTFFGSIIAPSTL